MSTYRTSPDPDTKAMPSGIPYIVANEAAERFSFYGMKAALVIFMTKYLHVMGSEATNPMSEAAANEYQHLFVMAVYATPLIGAIISDAFFGKYKTIVWLSLVYCLGHGCLALIGLSGVTAFWLVSGLAFIAIGAGGIKPCVSAHVGDQFGQGNAFRLTTVFNLFYFSINLGASIANLMIPVLLAHYGPHIAFGLPGILMAIATWAFWLGRRKFVHVPPDGPEFVKHAFSASGLKTIGKLSILFLFVAMFWALFDQTATTWVFQAEDMNRKVLGLTLLPSQIQAANPFLILILIPLFTFVIYPLVHKKIPLTPLRKIGAGLFLMASSFALVAWTQERIDGGEAPSILWQVLAYVILTASEVMVSIVALEFAYTQAPRQMKSFIMSVFLLAVSLGNLFTALVNHSIQIDSPAALAIEEQTKSDAASIELSGMDGKKGTRDDLTFKFDGRVIDDVEFEGKEHLTTAVARVEAYVRSNQRLPKTQEGQELLAGLEDGWSQTLRYRQLKKNQCRISSDGPDGEPKTEWDVGVLVSLPETDPERPWLEARKKELGVKDESAGTDDKVIEDPFYYAGGQVRLEGASYFWFFTWLMLGTAVVFIPYALFYRGKTHLQE